MGIEVQCPRHVSRQRFRNYALPSLPRVRLALFPEFHGTMKRSDSLTLVPPRFVSFARRLPFPRACFRSSAKSDADWRPGSLELALTKPDVEEMETAGRPKFLGNPVVPAPCSRTPARPTL